jgi:hypothetical protein
MGGQERGRLAAIDAVSGAITSWDPYVGDYVYTLAASGSAAYAGGEFAGELVGLDAGTGSAIWSPSPDGQVRAVAVGGSIVYAGGYFGTIGGRVRNGIAALDAATGAVTDWNPNADPAWDPDFGGGVEAIAVSGTTVCAGGSFRSIGGLPQSHFAVITTGADVTAVDTQAPAGMALAPRANPSRGDLHISLSLPDASPARLELFDLAGRRLAARDVGTFGPGSHVVTLGEGRALPPGAYVLRLTQGARALTTRAVVLR